MWRILIVGIPLILSGCSISSSVDELSGKPKEEIGMLFIEDINCDSLYKLPVLSAESEDNSALVHDTSRLIDGDATNGSFWSSTSAPSPVLFELEKPTLLKELTIVWLDSDTQVNYFELETSKDKKTWDSVVLSGVSSNEVIGSDRFKLEQVTAKYLRFNALGNSIDKTNNIIEISFFGCSKTVNHSMELIDWYVSIPVDDNNSDTSDSIYEHQLAEGFLDSRFFYQSIDGGLVFSVPNAGYKTSENTSYTRTELREMLRRGNSNIRTQGVNDNNWVFSSAPSDDLQNAAGRDGELNVKIAVNKVTTTGSDSQVGRVVIGQIHANDDEPARLYYRKLPDNKNGSIYLAHEVLGGDDFYTEIIGNRSKSASNPANGIPLNEVFEYQIKVVANLLTVTVIRDNQDDVVATVDMSNSGYDVGDQYMYYKVGAYNQNNTGDPYDYTQVTVYQINNSHRGYEH